MEGAETLAEERLEVVLPTPLADALMRPWDSDAHFVTYALAVSGDWAETWPRCNKVSLPRIRAKGGELWSTCMVLDWDLPKGEDGKSRPWREGEWSAFVEKLRLGVQTPLDDWCWLYSTRHGARLIYALAHPIPVEQWEALVREILERWARLGLAFDDKCKDWTRLFRLPFVMRRLDDGTEVPTWEDPSSQNEPRVERRLDPASMPVTSAPRAAPVGTADAVEGDAPDIDKCRRLLRTVGESGRMAATPWARAAKKALEGRDCFDVCFMGALIAEPGSRDATIQRLVGEACAVLRRVPGSSPSLVFALFSDALEQLDAEPAGDGKARPAGWRAVCRYWQRESEKLAGEAQQIEVQQAQARSLEDRVLHGVREWCDAAELKGDDAAARWWLSTHLLCATERHLHVMTPSGYYDPIASTRMLLSARIRELGMDTLIPLWEAKANGEGQKPVDPQRLIDRFATRVRGIEGAICVKGTTIRDVGSNNATMIYRLFARRDIPPTYDSEVDLWLQYLVGSDPENYALLCRWIGYALDFEGGPICALSLAGAPGAGKKLLVQGLAECIDTECTGSAGDFGKYQEVFLRTPFLAINEGLARQGYGVQHVADQFRRYVSGDPMPIEPKFMDKVQVRNPLRVMFLANNLDVIQELTGNRDLSPEDRRALAIRILHLRASERAASWLRMRGGLAFTRGWIRPDGGGPTDFRVAKHFLYLYQTRPPMQRGNRLLVEGNIDDEMIAQMSTRSGSAPQVIETLIAMVERRPQLPALASAIRVEGTRIYVTTSGVCEAWRMFYSERRGSEEMNVKRAGVVLRGLCTTKEETEIVRDGSGGRVRWREIDPELLLREALEHGYPCTLLAQLAAGRRTMVQAAAQMAAT